MYSAQFPATGDVGTAAGNLTEGVGQAAWRQGAAAQRRNEQKWNMLWLMLQYVANIWNMCADLSQNLIAYIGWLFFLDNSALFTVFTASGQTKAVHNPAHCAGFADAFGGACHHDFVTRNFPVCKLEGSVSRQSNQIWLASSCILGQDSVEVRCRKCDEAAGDSMTELAQNSLWTRTGPDGALGELHFLDVSASFCLHKWKFKDDSDDVYFDPVGDAGVIILHVVLRPSRGEALVAECIGDAVKEYSKAWQFSSQVTACHRRSNCKGEQAEKLKNRNCILCCYPHERSSRTPLVHLRTARWQWIRLIGPWMGSVLIGTNNITLFINVYQCLSMFIHVYPCLSMFILVYLSHQNRIMLPPQKYAEVSWVSSKFLSATNSRASVDCHSEWAIPQDTHGTHVCLAVYSRRNPSNISNSMSFRRVIPVTWLWPGYDLLLPGQKVQLPPAPSGDASTPSCLGGVARAPTVPTLCTKAVLAFLFHCH